MKNYLIHFESTPWDTSNIGIEQKTYSDGDQKLRLIVFKDDFIEDGWCTKGHVGYVLEGEMKIDINGSIYNYKQGDALMIDSGEKHKHKVRIEKGKYVKLILFEKN